MRSVRAAPSSGGWLLLECAVSDCAVSELSRLLDELLDEAAHPRFRLWVAAERAHLVVLPARLFSCAYRVALRPELGRAWNSSEASQIEDMLFDGINRLHVALESNRGVMGRPFSIDVDAAIDVIKRISQFPQKHLSEFASNSYADCVAAVAEAAACGVTDVFERRLVSALLGQCLSGQWSPPPEALARLEARRSERLAAALALCARTAEAPLDAAERDSALVARLLALVRAKPPRAPKSEAAGLSAALVTALELCRVAEAGKLEAVARAAEGSLSRLAAALVGAAMSPHDEALLGCLRRGEVPREWRGEGDPAALEAWAALHERRSAQLAAWSPDKAPASFWLPGLFYPTSKF